MKLSLFNLTCIIFEGKIIYLIIKNLIFSIHVMISRTYGFLSYKMFLHIVSAFIYNNNNNNNNNNNFYYMKPLINLF
jgi:hypothetical protein